MSAIVKRSAREMIELLEAHYSPPPSKPPGGRLITEIQAPHSLRRADALYLPITTGDRGTIIGHEIKVSRSDVIAEVRDPHKADAWMRYCDRWWLVVSDASLIDGLDIPEKWGVMASPTRGRFMTIVTKAPTLAPDRSILVDAWGTIFAKTGFADIAATAEAKRYKAQAEQFSEASREQNREIARLTAALGDDTGKSHYRSNRLTVANILAELDRLGEYGDDAPHAFRGLTWTLDAEEVARGILAAAAVADERRPVTDDIVAAIERANNVAERLTQVLDEIQPKGTP
ncbi:hypothetical protein D8M34_06030 [Microbacterium sp. HSID17254]|uniref:hypothetical protein n=1 Tax=Microbacterium sp. HSID17254 TaxID=2419509 RepID=UPI000F89886A|nr:hypothetical protein [Microbacterium sp. HSID17254]RUQ07027.1 hypothetical protein D8M34_06030 [Microbacterium sp. HSID17254]